MNLSSDKLLYVGKVSCLNLSKIYFHFLFYALETIPHNFIIPINLLKFLRKQKKKK